MTTNWLTRYVFFILPLVRAQDTDDVAALQSEVHATSPCIGCFIKGKCRDDVGKESCVDLGGKYTPPPLPDCGDYPTDTSKYKIPYDGKDLLLDKCTTTSKGSENADFEKALKVEGVKCYGADATMTFKGYQATQPDGTETCVPCGQYESGKWTPDIDPNDSAKACGISSIILSKAAYPVNYFNKNVIGKICPPCAKGLMKPGEWARKSVGSSVEFTVSLKDKIPFNKLKIPGIPAIR